MTAGGVPAAIGGSSFVVIAGFLIIGSGALIGRDDPRGRWFFAALWLGPLVWAIGDVGFDGLQLVPRVVARTVLLILVLLTAGPVRRARRQSVQAVAPAPLAVIGAGYAVAGDSLQAQAGRSASAPRLAASLGDAGGHGALGTRYGDYPRAFALPRGA